MQLVFTQQGLCLAVLVLVFFKIIVSDIRYRLIKNYDVIIVLILVLLLRRNDMETAIVMQAVYVLIGGFIIVSLGICGAGDIKLFAVIALGIDPAWFMLTLNLMLWLGGALAVVMWLRNRLRHPDRRKLVTIPYAIPIVVSSSVGIGLSMLT
ncbi:prepilin peptidase [Vibrio tritonius]|uniref:Prepilin peptidase n=1 Tax=Vibrio tritonius TaxID=1435069 RepID=A0ABS7YHK8_9VIBR|nr:prepilin peptidase [Vibrio tritonius]